MNAYKLNLLVSSSEMNGYYGTLFTDTCKPPIIGKQRILSITANINRFVVSCYRSESLSISAGISQNGSNDKWAYMAKTSRTSTKRVVRCSHRNGL